MRVAIVSPRLLYFNGGAETALRTFIPWFLRDGFQITLLAGPGPLVEEAKPLFGEKEVDLVSFSSLRQGSKINDFIHLISSQKISRADVESVPFGFRVAYHLRRHGGDYDIVYFHQSNELLRAKI